MARGKFKKRNDRKSMKPNPQKKKYIKKKPQNFRDIKHKNLYAEYKLKLENERKKNVKFQEEKNECEEDNVISDPFTLLLSTFENESSKLSGNIAIESDDSSDDENEVSGSVNNDLLEENHDEDDNKISTESRYLQSNKSREYDSEYADDINDGKSDKESDIELFDDSDIEKEINNKSDPFHKHFNYDLDETLLDSVSSIPMKTKSSKLYWPVLQNLKVEIPIGGRKQKNLSETNNSNLIICDDAEYAKEGDPPKLIQTFDFNKLFIKSQFQKHIIEANKSITKTNGLLSGLQKELFSIINNYQDLFYCERTLDNGEEIRFIYCLHIVNHILKTRLKILHHNSKLQKKPQDAPPPDEVRDQGLIRPKVLIIVPFRESCLRIVNILASLLLSNNKANLINKKRFYDEFKGSELIMPKKNPKPEDYEQLFAGNIDDNFRIGLSLTKKSIKLYADFYSSDIVIASPLGLRMIIGAEGDKERDFDFLASIEILILDQAEVFYMQNWDHLLLIFEHLHIQPQESHGTDFSRVRSWALNGWAKFYRQTLLFSSMSFSELNAVFNRRCFNYAGKIRTVNPVEDGTICRVIVPLCHVFQKFKTDSAVNSLEDRFRVFTEKIIPQFKDTLITGVLIYVPSYFDYVRIRNHLKQSDYNFVQICEYSKDSKVARARDMFFHKEARILLYSERFHFFRRINLKGIRHVVFYQLPTIPHFYSEICNLMQESNQNRFLVNDNLMTVTVLYCQYDIHQLSNIVKTTRAAHMVASETDVHMFSTG